MQFRVNVRAPYALTQAALPHLRPDGAVVFVSSIAGHVGFPLSAAYCGTKGAIELMTKSLAMELAPLGVRVNAVAPGNIHTPMNEHLFESDDYERTMIERHAVRPRRRGRGHRSGGGFPRVGRRAGTSTARASSSTAAGPPSEPRRERRVIRGLHTKHADSRRVARETGGRAAAATKGGRMRKRIAVAGAVLVTAVRGRRGAGRRHGIGRARRVAARS